jgi:hypothetical protein
MKTLSEVDALIGEKVMGLDVSKFPIQHEHVDVEGRSIIEWEETIPCYSADIAAAWEVVAKFDTVEVKRWWDGNAFYWTAILTKHDPEKFSDVVRAETASLAICLAALKTIKEGE